MTKSFFKMDWVTGMWAVSFLWFLTGCGCLLTNMPNGNLHGDSFVFLLATIFAALIGGFNAFNSLKIRKHIATFFICFSILTLPLTLYSFGLSMQYAVLLGFFNVVLVIAATPWLQGLTVMCSALVMAFLIASGSYFKENPIFDERFSQKQAQASNLAEKTNDCSLYEVKKPATLQELSSLKKIYGNGDYWYTLYVANKDNLDIVDKTDNVPLGTVLRVPKVKGIPYKVKFYEVEQDMTVQELAALQGVYGDRKYYNYIVRANIGKIDEKSLIVAAGTKLIIPLLPETEFNHFFDMALIFICGMVLALLWKVTIIKLYRMLNIAYSMKTGNTLNKLKNYEEEMSDLQRQVDLLKHETVINILEMQQVIDQSNNNQTAVAVESN